MLCSERVVIDKETNNTSIFNILENMHSAGFPLFVQKFDFFALLQRLENDPQRIDLNLKIYNNDNLLLDHRMSADFQEKLRNRVTIHINGIAVPNPGILVVTLFLGNVALGSYEIKVSLTGSPTAR
jgi:hypothetical protein